MTARQIASLFIRLVAIFFLVRALPSMLSIGSSVAGLRVVGYSQALPMLVASIGGLILFVVLMIIIIRRSEWVATHLIKAQDAPVSLGSLTAADIQSIAFSWVGLLLISDAIGGLVYQLSQLRRLSAALGEPAAKVAFTDNIYSGIASNTTTMMLGIVLFIFPGGLARLWLAIQHSRPMKS